MQTGVVQVGVGLLVLRGDRISWSKRRGSHGAGTYGFLGGHVEYGETLQAAVLRELGEECGITVTNVQYLCTSDFLSYYPKHFVDVGFRAEWQAGEPQLLEPDKFERWEWRHIDDMPTPVFEPCKGYITALKTGRQYFTYDMPPGGS